MGYILEFYCSDTYKILDPNGYKTDMINEGINYFDAIFKIRNMANTTDFFNSKAIFLTETGIYKDMSKFLTQDNGILQNNYRLCVDMNMVTNVIWLKLGKGLGNINSIENNKVTMLAKMIVAKDNNKKLNDICKNNYIKFKNGEISKEAFSNTLAEVRSHKNDILPDSINNENSFICYDYICDATAVKQHNIIEKQKMKERILELETKQNDYDSVLNELKRYKDKEFQELNKKNERKVKIKKVFCVLLRIIITVFLIVLTIVLHIKYNSFFTYLCGFASLIPLLALFKKNMK